MNLAKRCDPVPAASPGLVSRMKHMILSPKTEWGVIASEPTTVAALYAGYVMPLALPAALLGSLRMPGDSLRIPILLFVSALFGVFILGLIIDVLAPTFCGRRDLRQAVKVAAYSLTPAGLSSILALAPPIWATPLQLMAGLYGLYLLHLGLPALMRSTREKASAYSASVVICAIVVGVVFAVLPSCAKAPSAAPPVVEPISACEGLVLKVADLGGFLQAPITHATALAGDGQSCAFLTTGFSAITVSVRPGLGKASLEAWSRGKMPLPARPLENVGDTAVWQDTLHEIIAQKNDVLCDIQIRGGNDDIAVASDALPGKLGALCNRIFAALGS